MREPHSFDGTEFRRVMGGFASGITIVTAMADGTPVGIAKQN